MYTVYQLCTIVMVLQPAIEFISTLCCLFQLEERWEKYERHTILMEQEEERKKKEKEREKEKKLLERVKLFKILQKREEGWCIWASCNKLLL